MRLSSIALRAVVLALAASGLTGCLAASVVGATVGVAGAAVGVAGTAVGLTAKAASTTVHVGHVAVDAVTPGGGDKDARDGRDRQLDPADPQPDAKGETPSPTDAR
jgi:hypothetical protein